MKSLLIRQKFFDYFTKHGHEKIASSSLIPAQDPTLLFTNAGMNQFKDLFLGKEFRSYKNAVTIQKCIRAGGKHNDLDNVGFTKRHLTFFEMMGNFSFGDYFKKEAIPFAWNFLTKELGLNSEEMYVSVFREDQESYDIWNKDMKVPAHRIFRFDEKDNFWQMGDTGPCGPCTEMYVDIRSQDQRSVAPTQADFDEGRLLEVWNVVFMQYDRQPDGTLVPLKQTGVDTGMGFERITSVLQGADSVYQTDIFKPLIAATEKLTGVNYAQATPDIKAAFHVLADHVRSTSFIIADGGSPSNEGRGYVLRKIIRRAALFAQKLSSKNIFPELAKTFIQELSSIYPELEVNKTIIVNLLTNEIEQFAQNLVRGQSILANYFEEQKTSKTITGQQAFKLYDTYGFPLEVTILAAQESGYTVDTKDFETAMEQQRALSGKKMKEHKQEVELPETMISEFVGYTVTHMAGNIIGIIADGKLLQEVKAGTECFIITDITPFFAATGGQVDDAGTVEALPGEDIHIMQVLGLQKFNNNKAIGIKIIPSCALKVGDIVVQKVDMNIRRMTMNNHTATHLLQAALIELLGKQVKQSGSVVTPDYLRFDFTYHTNLTQEQITWVENRVNEKIRENIRVDITETTYKKALDKGVIAIFGEKYNPECVRVIDVPGFSAELCGGTHVPSTGVIGAFKITEMGALSAGNRRIVALTGVGAMQLMQDNFNTVKSVCQFFKIKPDEVMTTIEKQQHEIAYLQKSLREAKQELIKASVCTWIDQYELKDGTIPFFFTLLNNYTLDGLKEIALQLEQRRPAFFVLCSNSDGKGIFYLHISNPLHGTIDLKNYLNLLQQHGFKGGGKAYNLQGTGPEITKEFKNFFK